MSNKSELFRLLKSFAGAAILLVCIFFVLILTGVRPMLTNSVSFDSKIVQIQERKIRIRDIISIGSSITLNNLESKTILDSLTHMSYYNFSSWGLQMSDVNEVTGFLLTSLRPKMVLICSSIPDFRLEGNSSIASYVHKSDFSRENWKETFYLENYSPISDLISRKLEYNRLRSETQDYNSLAFDSSGGVILCIPANKIDSIRWNLNSSFPTSFTQSQYRSLEKLCDLLQKAKLYFAFIQSPIKQLYYNSPGKRESVANHLKICRAIVESRGGLLLDYSFSQEFTSDSMFVDQFHLSARGADLFTRNIVSQLKKRFELQN